MNDCKSLRKKKLTIRDTTVFILTLHYGPGSVMTPITNLNVNMN
jgi:hypothetical protein